MKLDLQEFVTSMNRCCKVTTNNIDDFIENHNHICYCEAIIGKDGLIGMAKPCHINSLVGELSLTLDEAYKIIPVIESPLDFLLYKTGAIAIWYKFFMFNRAPTKEQLDTLYKLADSDIVEFDREYVDNYIKEYMPKIHKYHAYIEEKYRI